MKRGKIYRASIAGYCAVEVAKALYEDSAVSLARKKKISVAFSKLSIKRIDMNAVGRINGMDVVRKLKQGGTAGDIANEYGVCRNAIVAIARKTCGYSAPPGSAKRLFNHLDWPMIIRQRSEGATFEELAKAYGVRAGSLQTTFYIKRKKILGNA